MSLKNMSLLFGGTTSTTGGTAMVFADDGVTIQNGVHLTVPATADYQVREQATAKYRPPVLRADGSYAKDKKSISFAIPIVLASGKIEYNVIRVEREVHPEFTATEAANLLNVGAQLLSDSDLDNFWSAGSLS